MITRTIYLKNYFPELGEDGCNAYLECYIPSKILDEGNEELQSKRYPCMVICPGGGYYCTCDREAEPVAMQFAAEGYRVVVVRYSCLPHAFPQQLREIAGAMELVYQFADEWNIDEARIAIIGFSAGGHLAAQYSNRYECEAIRQLFPESKPVQACILCYPVITDSPAYTNEWTIQNYLGYTPTQRNEKGCSNECAVSRSTPPTFLWHTAEDQAVPVQNSLLYAKALSDHGVPYEMHIYTWGEHGLSTVDGVVYAQEQAPNVMRARSWLTDVKTWLKAVGIQG